MWGIWGRRGRLIMYIDIYNTNKKYNTIVIDPPWNISLTGRMMRRNNRADKLPYKTMPLDGIKGLPIANLANKGAHIYLWTTNKMLYEAFHILESWGIRFHLALVMVKPSGIAPALGYVFGTEFCLLGINGKPMQKFLKTGELNWFVNQNKKGWHSRKPEYFYYKVEHMSPEPRLDMFSRRPINGWDVWGDEAEKLSI